jgi:17beta-estradiol 17-dehydrogenase / very-long-chain 3-oxoacyl-CoA reductase
MISVNNFGNIPEFSYLEIIALIFILIFICKLLFSLFRGFWTCFLGHFLGFGVKWPKGDNLWAVITGGTDGIGLEYTKQLAAKGFSLMIISRTENKLKTVAQSIKEQYSQCKEVFIILLNF